MAKGTGGVRYVWHTCTMAWGCLWKEIAIDMQFVYHAMFIMKLKCLFSYGTPSHQILFPAF